MTDASAAAGGKTEVAYRWLRERILRHELGAGYRLVLRTLAEELGVSMVPVREAILRLEAEGLVTVERNVGARVAAIDEREYANTLQTLGLLEGLATALAAPLLDPTTIERAEAMNEALRAQLDEFDAREFSRVDEELHAVLTAACPNEHLVSLVHRGWARLSGIRDPAFGLAPGAARRTVEEHMEILDLVRSPAHPLEIEMAARRHRWRTLDEFLAGPRPIR